MGSPKTSERSQTPNKRNIISLFSGRKSPKTVYSKFKQKYDQAKTHRKQKSVKGGFRKELYVEAIEKLKQENKQLKHKLGEKEKEVKEKDRKLKEKEVYIMHTLEEFNKQKEKQQNEYDQKIQELSERLESQRKYLGELQDALERNNIKVLERMSMTGSTCSCQSEVSKDRFKSSRGSEEIVFELSRTASEMNVSELSKINEEIDLKFTGNLLDDYLYESKLFDYDEVSSS